MNLQLNYHHLRYFLGVAAEGGIKAAAKALHVSSPTLSAQVRQLEGFLGAPLFVREGKKLVPTDAGRVVRCYAERIFSMGDEMLEVVRRGSPTGPQTLHLGLGDAVPKLLVSSILIRSRHQAPDIKFVVREGMPGELYPALAAHQIDVVIANEPPTGSFRTVLFSRRAGKFAVSFVAAPTLAKKYRRARRLDGFPVLVPTWESPLRRELDRWWADEGIHPDICAEFDDAAAMCEMAADGAGAAPLPEPMLQSARERFGLQVLPLRTGVHEELFVVTAERQFAHEGARILARVAGVPVRAGKAKRR